MIIVKERVIVLILVALALVITTGMLCWYQNFWNDRDSLAVIDKEISKFDAEWKVFSEEKEFDVLYVQPDYSDGETLELLGVVPDQETLDKALEFWRLRMGVTRIRTSRVVIDRDRYYCLKERL